MPRVLEWVACSLEAKETKRGREASVIMILLLLVTWGEITMMGGVEIRKAFQDLLANKARLKDVCGAEGVRLWRAPSVQGSQWKGKAGSTPRGNEGSHFSRV